MTITIGHYLGLPYTVTRRCAGWIVRTVRSGLFYRDPSLPRALQKGQQIVVTEYGETSFVVVKPGQPPQPTTVELAELAAQLLPGRRRKIDTVRLLRDLRS